jgi:hypothetical protein
MGLLQAVCGGERSRSTIMGEVEPGAIEVITELGRSRPPATESGHGRRSWRAF